VFTSKTGDLRSHLKIIILNVFNPNSQRDSEPFDLYNYGIKVFEDKKFNENFEDNLRHFAEECDYIQVLSEFLSCFCYLTSLLRFWKGFQFFVDAYNGFGGLTQKSLNLLNEEYVKKPIFSFLSFPFYDQEVSPTISFNIKTTFQVLINSISNQKGNWNEYSKADQHFFDNQKSTFGEERHGNSSDESFRLVLFVQRVQPTQNQLCQIQSKLICLLSFLCYSIK
jgi:hypothetical protein